jgi:hypothetical protein
MEKSEDWSDILLLPGYTTQQKDLIRINTFIGTKYHFPVFLATDPEVPGSIPGATRFF